MLTVSKRLFISVFAFVLLLMASLMVPQTSLADTLTGIYESAVQNDPVLRAARANFNADRENKKYSPRCATATAFNIG